MKMIFNKLGTTLLLVTALSAPHANANMIYAATMDDGPSIEEVHETLDQMQRAQLNQNIEVQEMILQLATGNDDPVITERAEAAKLKIAEYKQELARRDAAVVVAQEAEQQARLNTQAFNKALAKESDVFIKEIGTLLSIVAGIFIIGIIGAGVIYNRIAAKDKKEKSSERPLRGKWGNDTHK